MKRRTKVILIVVGVIPVLLVVAWIALTRGLSDAQSLEIGKVDLAQVADGTYEGRYENGRFTSGVAVHVEDHRITGIDVVRAVPAPEQTDSADEMIRRVLDAQDAQVDVVAGATATSKAYLKAIENALTE